MTSRTRKVAVIGLDSITPVMVERFLAEGRMPNLARLRAKGFWTEVTPTMPPTTAAGWTTVATGAWPSTHGIEGFAVHTPGDPLDAKTHSLTTDHVRAEQLWRTAQAEGLETILLKYPVSWPPVGGSRVIQVDGAGGWGGLKCVFDVVHSGCWDTDPEAAYRPPHEEVAAADWMTRDADNLDEEATQRVETGPPGVWGPLPPGFEPAWEGSAELRSRGGAACRVRFLAGSVAGAGRLLVRTAYGVGDQPVAEGEWTEWLALRFDEAGDIRRGSVRFKVCKLDVAKRRLRLYQSQVHDEERFTRPAALAKELTARVGPFVEWTESYDLLQGWIDHQTQLEIYEQHVDWMSRAARHLLNERSWRLFLTQIHVIDMAYHIYWGALDPRHPDYDEGAAPRYWELLGRVHELADSFLGAVVDELDDDTLVIALGDHGHDLYHSALMVNHLLLREGFLSLFRDPRTGRARIDWSQTAAYAQGYRIYLNVRGRDPDGTVDALDVPALQQRVVAALQRVRDDSRGSAPVRLALAREDARALGLYGPAMGDVVFALGPGYQARSTIQLPRDAWVGRRLAVDRVPLLKPTHLFREFTGDHDTAAPWTHAIRTLLCLHGPGVRNDERAVPVDLVDVAPTICAWLGLRPPAHCEGKPILDAFEAAAAPLAPPRRVAAAAT
jgi:predicted AlkP superfamily phosphohydrolase/phosphomutase